MSSWIVDGSANRIHKSYLKGFLDISGGNVYIRTGNFYINQGDISCNGNLIIQNDISCNGSISFEDNLNSISATEFNYLGGVTSNIQTQINDLSNSCPGITFDNSFSGVNHFQGDVSFASNVTFDNTPVLASYSVPTLNTQFVTKKYVDDAAGGAGLDVNSDLSLNAGLSVGGDASFNQDVYIFRNVQF